MSYQPLWLRDLVAYSIQAAAMVGVGVVMARVLRLRMPRVRHAYWQALLALCVFLPLLQPWRPEVLETSGATLSNITFAATAAVAAPAGPSLAEIVLWLICAGIVLRLAWMALGLGRLWLYRRHAERINQTPEAVREAQRLVPASSSFFISRQVPTPATFGFFQPAILFPARFLDMEPAMQKAIALHELLHVERRDWLWNMFEEIVLTLLWFHLPLWWVVRSARLSREQVVDAEAVRRSHARRPYLKALLEMAGQKRLAESLPAPLFLRESQLAERVALMMKEVHMSRTRLTFSILTAAVTLLIAGASLVWAFPLKTSAQQTEAPAVASVPAPSEAEVAASTALPGNAVVAESEADRKIGKVYKVGGKVSAPIPIYKPEPPYTPEALKAHLSGIVVFWAVIDAKGKVVAVRESSKPLGQGLDESAMKTIRTWRFNPGMREGVAVPVEVMIEVSFRPFENGKPDPPSQNSDPAADPPGQENQTSSADANADRSAYINQEEIQRQVDEAMKQAEIAQEASSRVDQEKIQQQIEKAMKQANIAQKNFAKVDQAKIQRQVDEAMKQLQRMDTPEMRQELKQALEQAKIAQQAAAEVNRAEIQREVERARKEVDPARLRAEAERARKDAAAARKEAEMLREQLKKERLQSQKQRKEAKPVPPVPPKPSPVPPKEVSPPPPPPPPPPPQTPESAAVVGGVTGGVIGGVPGGVVEGVPGGRVKGIQGGQVIGVPGGITGGEITAPQPPVAPSTSPKEVVPPPAPASPTPPPPQN